MCIPKIGLQSGLADKFLFFPEEKVFHGGGGGGRDASEGKGPHRRPQRRLGRRLEEVAKAVGGGYCRLQMGAYRALCARCAKSRPFSTTGRQFFGCRIAAGYYCRCVSL